MNNLQFHDLKENIQHCNFIMPFSLYEGRIDPAISPSIPIHWHEEFEVILVIDGRCNYKIDLEAFIIEKGDILMIGPQKLHTLNSINDITLSWTSFVFNIDMLKSLNTDGALLKYISPILNNNHQIPLIIKNNDTYYDNILTVIKDIITCYKEKDIAYELELKSLLYKLFSLFYKGNLIVTNTDKNIINTKVTDKVKLVLNYIHDNYSNNISINTLANICDYSEYHFMRFFKKHIGMTCIQYINNYRLEKASLLLNSTSKPIMDISLEVGFDNLSYFNKLFKNKYNLTPKEFRSNKNKVFT